MIVDDPMVLGGFGEIGDGFVPMKTSRRGFFRPNLVSRGHEGLVLDLPYISD